MICTGGLTTVYTAGCIYPQFDVLYSRLYNPLYIALCTALYVPKLEQPSIYSSPFHSISNVEASNSEIFSLRATFHVARMLLHCKIKGSGSLKFKITSSLVRKVFSQCLNSPLAIDAGRPYKIIAAESMCEL